MQKKSLLKFKNFSNSQDLKCLKNIFHGEYLELTYLFLSIETYLLEGVGLEIGPKCA